MESGIIVEYIEQQRVLCAVVLNGQEERVRLLNENGRRSIIRPAASRMLLTPGSM